MEGEFQVEAHKKNHLKQQDLVRMILITVGLYLYFLLLFLFPENDRNFSELFWLSMLFIVIMGITLTLRYFFNSPLDNTIIIIEENQITRKGRGLRTVTISFDKITKVKKLKLGVILFDDRYSSRLKFNFSHVALTDESGILFIPINIEKYEEVKCFVLDKIELD